MIGAGLLSALGFPCLRVSAERLPILPCLCAVYADGSLLVRWEVDASDALPATLAPGLHT